MELARLRSLGQVPASRPPFVAPGAGPGREGSEWLGEDGERTPVPGSASRSSPGAAEVGKEGARRLHPMETTCALMLGPGQPVRMYSRFVNRASQRKGTLQLGEPQPCAHAPVLSGSAPRRLVQQGAKPRPPRARGVVGKADSKPGQEQMGRHGVRRGKDAGAAED